MRCPHLSAAHRSLPHRRYDVFNNVICLKAVPKKLQDGDDASFDVSLLEACLKKSSLNPSSKILDFAVKNIRSAMRKGKPLVQWDEDYCWTFVLKSVFQFVDKDKSGHLDCDEMLDCLAEVGVVPTRERVKQIISEYDVDDTGVIEEDEFVAYMLHKYASEGPKDKPDVSFPLHQARALLVSFVPFNF